MLRGLHKSVFRFYAAQASINRMNKAELKSRIIKMTLHPKIGYTLLNVISIRIISYFNRILIKPVNEIRGDFFFFCEHITLANILK